VTDNPTKGFAAPSRRSLMQAAVGAAGAAAILARPSAGAAAPSISKAAVAYQDQPEGDKECDKCVQFVAPASCKVVAGTISPQGCCRIFQPVQRSG
jgi:hypothetical protein